jgi:hypothetical protein
LIVVDVRVHTHFYVMRRFFALRAGFYES